MTTSDSRENEIARRLLAREAAERDAPGGPVAAAERVLTKLHAHLARWLGADGSHAVLARALDRARPGHRALADARIEPRGERALTGLTTNAPAADVTEVSEALAAVIAAVITLLTRLIGADLVARLLQQTWPDEGAGAIQAGGIGTPAQPGAPPGHPNAAPRDGPRADDTRLPE